MLDRDGVLTRGLTDRLGIDGRRENERLLREGIDGRELGRETDRLGADRVTDLLGALARLPEDLLRDDPPSAANASNRTAALATAITARPGLRISFTRIITNLLSPAVILHGNPGLPFPHHRRHEIRHLRSCGTWLSSYTPERGMHHKTNSERSLRSDTGTGRIGASSRLVLDESVAYMTPYSFPDLLFLPPKRHRSCPR